MSDANTFRSIFSWMMGFVGIFWVWTVTLMIAWPWQKTSQWEPDMRVFAICANKDPCSVRYSELTAEKAAGKIVSLVPTEPVGEFLEPDAWLRWSKATEKPWQWEVKRSSWNFEYTVRYRLEGETPALVEARGIDSNVMVYAFPLAIFTLMGLLLRRTRKT